MPFINLAKNRIYWSIW